MIDTVYRLWQKGGLTIVLIEHDMDIVFRVSRSVFMFFLMAACSRKAQPTKSARIRQ
jgi:ABC-type branched-subunit amino acid transport system ATPase component